MWLRTNLAISFAVATVALPYARYTNNHILLLAVVAGIMLIMARGAELATPDSRVSLLVLGTLTGLGYGIDLGAGPMLMLCVSGWILYRFCAIRPTAAFAAAALPWLILHHAINYQVGGTWKPANAIPEYFNWPGCTFNASTMTGAWHHSSVGRFVIYALGLLIGKRGFLDHNLALFLAAPGWLLLVRHRPRELPELLFTAAWCVGTWLLYALTSSNSSGLCCSIRWFVPFLAPGYYVLAVLLRRFQHLTGVFLVLTGWGAIMGALMWWKGPWMRHMVPFYWPLQAGCLLTLIVYWWRRQRGAVHALPPEIDRKVERQAA
jgi:hypothetical protein